MSLKIKKWIAGLPEYIAGRTLEEIKEEYGISEVYKLASNENLFGLPEGLAERIEAEIKNVYYYPDAGCTMIRDKLSGFYGLLPDEVIIGVRPENIEILMEAKERTIPCFVEEIESDALHRTLNITVKMKDKDVHICAKVPFPGKSPDSKPITPGSSVYLYLSKYHTFDKITEKRIESYEKFRTGSE